MQPVVAARGADALLPWLILGAGAVVAVLAGWLGENRTRRARAQGELDRIFNLSSDLIAVVDFEGRFTRVNPAVEHILGYTQEELVARPYLDFVHPDDRRKTAAQATAIARGKTMSAFENRFLRKDGSERVLEWTATPVAERGVMYGVGRDVTDRRFTDAELDRLADEQAALRRVATRIAREASQADVFAQIADEIRRLLGAEEIRMFRYDEEPSAVVVGAAGSQGVFPLGSRESLDGDTCTSRVFRTGQTARIDDYGKARGSMADAARTLGVLSAVGAPILVDGRVWGAIVAGWIHGEPPPPDTEWRLGQFTELMATAISNTESRSEVQRLADEQAALRRVATLVAEGASPPEVFDAVAAEMERLLDPDQVALCRYEPGAEVTIVAYRGNGAEIIPPGTRASHKDGDSATAAVWRTQRPARIDHVDAGGDGIPALARMLGARTSVGTPVVMDGRLWGVITASWTSEEAPRGDTEERMAHFAQLLETAIANADSHVQLDASRARLLSEADEARRRLVRDLHDGAQQRLVQTILTLKLARQALGARERETQALIAEALAQADRGNVELRELAHGILPPVLTRGGLRAGVDALVTRLDLRVDVDIPADRFPGEIEASAYFIVAEGLTNVVKHAHAEHAEVSASVEDGLLRVDVRDDGSGGADPDGHGLIGLRDRVTALGGGLTVESPSSGGTWLRATLPVDAT
jgi:PAS domain S-box-containing protein